MLRFFIADNNKKHVWALSLLAIGAIVGLMASFVLSVEAIELTKNANAKLPCSLSAALDCAAVGIHPTAHIFGFPNAFIGLMALSVIVTIAIALLMGARLPKVFMFMAQLGAGLGAIFALWMFVVSYTVIQVMCPWCLTTDVAMIVIFLALTRYNIIEGNLYLRKKADVYARRFVGQGFDVLLGIAIVMVMVVLLIAKFGNSLF